MTAEIVEGEAREIPEERAVVAQPGQALVAATDNPAAMVDVASRLATVLRDIVERQRLYATISGKKYPQVEAWMTIGRLDNVVAREPKPPIRHEDGSYEAFADLIRLSDGLVVGSSSALCGTADDRPWNGRSEPARRSMAQTRATSRAFRQQYSWIMALAGYEATPAEEMPHDAPRTPQEPARASTRTFTGMAVRWNQRGLDGQLRETPDGMHYGFILECEDEKKRHVHTEDALAQMLAEANPIGQVVKVTGPYRVEDLEAKGKSYKAGVILATDVTAPDGTPLAATATLFSPDEQAALDAAIGA